MADKLQEIYEEWSATVANPVDFAIFAGGFTAGAVSMRERAVKVAQTAKGVNNIINGIGALSDIPQ
jgi:hypothetical protein